jgi:hypothetical protein
MSAWGYSTWGSGTWGGIPAATGVQATGNVGSVTTAQSKSIALTGVSASGSAGTVTASQSKSAALTGIQAIGGTGTVTKSSAGSVGLNGVQASGNTGILGVATSASVALTGVVASGSAGVVSATKSFALTGISATGGIGSVSASQAATQTLSGVQASGLLGAQAIPNTWGYGTWGSGNWGSSSNPTFALTGAQAVGAIGVVGFTKSGSVALTGAQATGNAGTVGISSTGSIALTGVRASGNVGVVQPPISIALTGVQSAGNVGAAVVSKSGSVELTGVQTSGTLGSVVGPAIPGLIAYGYGAWGGNLQNAGLSPVSATGGVGSLTPSSSSTVTLTGVQAAGLVAGFGNAWGYGTWGFGLWGGSNTVSVALTGVQASGAVSSTLINGSWGAGTWGSGRWSGTSGVSVALTGVQASGFVTSFGGVWGNNTWGYGPWGGGFTLAIALSGVQARGAVGTIQASNSATIQLSGVQASGQVGTLLTTGWVLINDNQTANWQNIATTQTSAWQNVSTVPNWGGNPTAINDIKTILKYCLEANAGAVQSPYWATIYNYVNSYRLLVTGSSAGGHLAVMGVGNYSTVSGKWPLAVGSTAGPMDLVYSPYGYNDNPLDPPVQALVNSFSNPNPAVTSGTYGYNDSLAMASSPRYQYGNSTAPGNWYPYLNAASCMFYFIQNNNDTLTKNTMVLPFVYSLPTGRYNLTLVTEGNPANPYDHNYTTSLSERVKFIAAEAFGTTGSANAGVVTTYDIPYGPDRLQKVDLLVPSSAPKGVIVYIHGGGWSGGSKSAAGFSPSEAAYTNNDNAEMQKVAQAGYIVINCNYRLTSLASYGYGGIPLGGVNVWTNVPTGV